MISFYRFIYKNNECKYVSLDNKWIHDNRRKKYFSYCFNVIIADDILSNTKLHNIFDNSSGDI